MLAFCLRAGIGGVEVLAFLMMICLLICSWRTLLIPPGISMSGSSGGGRRDASVLEDGGATCGS